MTSEDYKVPEHGGADEESASDFERATGLESHAAGGDALRTDRVTRDALERAAGDSITPDDVPAILQAMRAEDGAVTVDGQSVPFSEAVAARAAHNEHVQSDEAARGGASPESVESGNTREELLAQCGAARTREELAQALQDRARNGVINLGWTTMPVDELVELVRTAHYSKIPDAALEDIIFRIDTKSQEEVAAEKRAEAQHLFESAQNLDELAAAVRLLDDGTGHFMSDSGAGKLSVSRTVEAILAARDVVQGRSNAFALNVSDSRVQTALARVLSR